MSFVSVEFILFLILTIFAYFIIPKKIRFLVLLIANTVFYAWGCGWNILFLIASAISVYVGGLAINKFPKHKKLSMLTVLLLNVGTLSILKEHNFFIENFNKMFGQNFSLWNIAVPMGISYYTLVALGYLIDVYLGKIKATKNFFKVYLTTTFFPLMVEGPIVKFNEVADNLFEGQSFYYNNLKYGFLRILLGFAKKIVLADRVAVLVDKVFAGSYSGPIIIVAMILYVVQIYAEFSGCMDIVLGIAKIFNIKLPENFKEPFASKNVSEFWRRWHITLGRWLKDYIYFPLVMSKFSMKISRITHKKLPRFLADTISNIIPLFFVWFTMGIWHGYGSKYVLYGMYWFDIIIVGMLLKPVFDFIINKLKIKTKCFSFRLFQMLRTFGIVTLGLALFRADTVDSLIYLLKGALKSGSFSISQLLNGTQNLLIIMFCVLALIIYDFIKFKGFDIEKWFEEQNLVFRYLVFVGLLFFVLTLGMYGYGYDPSSFIYGGF